MPETAITGTAHDARAELRQRLVAMRAELVELLARDRINAGYLRLLVDTSASIAALDADAAPVDVTPVDRAIISDDGRTIRLTLYIEASAVATVDLDSVRAVGLARELLAAALPRLR